MSDPKPRGSLNSSEALPVTPAEITADWCSKILGRPINDVTIVEAIHGTASKILVDITEETVEEHTPQSQRVCVKGGFNPEFVSLHPGLNATYRREAEFYYHIAPIVDMRLPKTWYCGSDTVSGQGIVVMDDLSVKGCTFGTPLVTWPVERVRAGVEQLAALHAKTWNATPERFPWLLGDSALGKSPFQGMLLHLLSPTLWAISVARSEGLPVPDYMANRERMEAAFKTLWQTADPKFSCVVHGDPHIGNTFIVTPDEPGFIDWQVLHIGSAFHDVSYFITGALTIDDRRQHEADLVNHYLASLARLGGPELKRADIWDEYRKNILHGFAWALTAPQMQPKENIFAMAERHAAAIDDHKSLELLEALPEYKRAG